MLGSALASQFCYKCGDLYPAGSSHICSGITQSEVTPVWPNIAKPSPSLGEILSDGLQAKPLTGGSSPYYSVRIGAPTGDRDAYTAECNDIIEALQMNFAEGNVFKAVWRMAAQRLGNGKPGTTAKYDAEKIAWFGNRLVKQCK